MCCRMSMCVCVYEHMHFSFMSTFVRCSFIFIHFLTLLMCRLIFIVVFLLRFLITHWTTTNQPAFVIVATKCMYVCVCVSVCMVELPPYENWFDCWSQNAHGNNNNNSNNKALVQLCNWKQSHTKLCANFFLGIEEVSVCLCVCVFYVCMCLLSKKVG